MKCFALILCLISFNLFGANWFDCPDYDKNFEAPYYEKTLEDRMFNYYDYNLDHKRKLIIESHLYDIEHIIEKNSHIIPFNDYQDLIFHIFMIENTV